MLKTSLTIILSLFITSCGFHLRGATPLAPSLHHLYLKTPDPNGQLSRNLAEYLKLSGVQLGATPAQATTVLMILNEEMGKQLLSVGGTQQTRQYNLTLTVTFQLTDANGTILVPPQTLSETQPFTIQSDQILGGSNEQTNIYQQMRRRLVYNIMNRLASKEVDEALTKKP